MADDQAVATFECFYSQDEASASATSTRSLTLEEGKKSSFILDCSEGEDDEFGVEKPAHLFLQATASSAADKSQHQAALLPFVLGGFELVSNSRSIEVYVTDDDKKEEYLTTCRGIKVDTNSDLWYKVLLVVPGGPRSMTRLRLKMLSIRPPKSTKSILQLLKVKGRLPQIEIQQQATMPATAAATRSSIPMQQQQQQHAATSPSGAAGGLDASDISAAMAGMQFMVRSTETRIVETMQSNLQQLQTNMMGGIQQALLMQATQLQQLQGVVHQQNQLITQQHGIIQGLQQQQVQLVQSMETLKSSVDRVRNDDEATRIEQEDPPPAATAAAVSAADDSPKDNSVEQTSPFEAEEQGEDQPLSVQSSTEADCETDDERPPCVHGGS